MSVLGWDTFRRADLRKPNDDWVVWLTDDELELLMQVAEPAIGKPMGRDELTPPEPLPTWAPVVVRRLRTQARWRRRKMQRATPDRIRGDFGFVQAASTRLQT